MPIDIRLAVYSHSSPYNLHAEAWYLEAFRFSNYFKLYIVHFSQNYEVSVP